MAPASAKVRFNANATNIAKGKNQTNFASLLMNWLQRECCTYVKNKVACGNDHHC